MKAADQLAAEKIYIRILDPFTVKPIDKDTIIQNAKAVGGKIVTVEDHYLEGNVYVKMLYILACNPGFSLLQKNQIKTLFKVVNTFSYHLATS